MTLSELNEAVSVPGAGAPPVGRSDTPPEMRALNLSHELALALTKQLAVLTERMDGLDDLVAVVRPLIEAQAQREKRRQRVFELLWEPVLSKLSWAITAVLVGIVMLLGFK